MSREEELEAIESIYGPEFTRLPSHDSVCMFLKFFNFANHHIASITHCFATPSPTPLHVLRIPRRRSVFASELNPTLAEAQI